MSSADQLAVLEVSERNDLESLLMQFDQDWTAQSLNDYRTRLQSSDRDVFRKLALSELVKIDLQRLWAGGEGQRVEDYLAQIPELGTVDSVDPELILAEFSARKAVDPDLSLSSYASRFPKQSDRVVQLASQIIDSQATSLAAGDGDPGAAQASIDTSRVDNLRDTASETKRSTKQLPAEFGRYRIIRELGSGAMGTVYLAHDSQLDRRVAIKTPSFSGAGNEDVIARFYREARAAAKIQHRNICPVYDVGKIDDRHFISMAFVKGREMSDYIKPDALPPQRTSALLIHRLAIALAEAHRHNVIHRDLKPANIMIDTKREPVVMDFGLARQTDVESRMTNDGTAVGTPAYMSPEQVRGENDDVGPAADIYALGVILYELLTGKLPFRGSIAQVVYQIVNEEPVVPSKLTPGVEPELESICAKMMAKSVDQRYASMDAVAADMKDYLKGKKKAAGAEPSSSQPHNDSSSTARLERVTETGALNAFFAAQAFEDPAHTAVEPPTVAKPRPLVQTRTKASPGGGGRHVKRIAIGLGGFFLLAGVIIYFTDGSRVEIPDGTEAKVETNADGTLKSITTSPASDETRSRIEKETGIAGSADMVPDIADSGVRVRLVRQFGDDVTLRADAWRNGRDGKKPKPNADRFALAFWPNSNGLNRVVHSLTADGKLAMHDVQTGNVIPLPPELPIGVSSVVFSEDGSQLLLGTDKEPAQVSLWDLSSSKRLKIFDVRPDCTVESVMFNTTGDVFAVTRVEKAWRVWKWDATGENESTSAEIGSRGYGSSVAISPDGKTFLANLSDNNSRKPPALFDRKTGDRLLVDLPWHDDRKTVGDGWGWYSPDGRYLATSAYDRSAIVSDAKTGKELWRLKHSAPPTAVAFSPDSRYLVTGLFTDLTNTFWVWNLQTGKPVIKMPFPVLSPEERVNYSLIYPRKIVFAPDGRHFAFAATGSPLTVWKIEDSKPSDFPDAKPKKPLLDLDLDSGAATIDRPAAESSKQELEQQSIIFEESTDHASEYDKGNNYAVAFSPNGEIVDTASPPGTMRIRNVLTGEGVSSPTDRQGIEAVAWSADRSQMVLGLLGGTIEVWQDGQPEPMHSFRMSGSPRIRRVMFSPDNRRVIACGDLKSEARRIVESWSLADGSSLGTIDIESNFRRTPSRVFGLDVSSDGSIAAIASGHGVQLWSLETNQRLQTIVTENISDFRALVNSVVFSNDGKLLGVGGYRNLNIVEVSTGKILHTLITPRDKINAIAFSPNGQSVVSGSWFVNPTVRDGVTDKPQQRQRFIEWDLASGRQIREWQIPVLATPRHLVFSANGRYLAAAGNHFPLRVWEM